jgi:hypothetical protein
VLDTSQYRNDQLNAGIFGPNALDTTLGPKVVYQRADDLPDQPPSVGRQFFDHIKIAGDTSVMFVALKDLEEHTPYSAEELQPGGAATQYRFPRDTTPGRARHDNGRQLRQHAASQRLGR